MEGIFPEVGEENNWSQVLVQTCLYGYILSIAANMIGDGAELLLLVPSAAPVVGSIVLPILGAVPDGMMVLCSGLGPDAQNQVKVGVGALAGSTIMLLTIPWFLAVWVGRVSITKKGELTYKKPAGAPVTWSKLNPNEGTMWFHTGVLIGDPLKKNAKIMLITCSSYLLIQGPAFLVDNPDHTLKQQARFENKFAWAGLALTIFWFVWYLYLMWQEGKSNDGAVAEQIIQANVLGIQEGQLTLRGAMAQFRQTTWDTLCAKTGLEEGLLGKGGAEDEVRRMCKLMVPFFRKYDQNQDNQISLDEFRLIMQDLHENIDGDVQGRIFRAADADDSGSISFEEFIACMMAFALDPNDSLMYGGEEKGVKRLPGQGAYLSEGGDDEDDADEEEDMPEDLSDLPPEEQQRRIKRRAAYFLIFGTVLVLLFSDPMTDMLGVIGNKMGVDPFYVSFVLAPIASNASELVSSMKLATPKTPKSMVQALSTLEGAAIMNNTFCLSIFLVLIVWKDLVWQFSAETVSIVVVQLLMALMVIPKRTQTLFDGALILGFYPVSLLIVYGLENFMGLD